jgi:DNA polymerase-1
MSVFSVEDVFLPKPNYEYINSTKDLPRALEHISKYEIIEVDTETTGLDPYLAKPVLLQIGLPNKVYIFDVRYDTEHSDIKIDMLKSVLTGNEQLRLFQNALFDMKMIKIHGGFYVENIYDTLIVEQLLCLGLPQKNSLDILVKRYLNITMPKEPRGTFSDYYQTFQPFQLEYAANDVVVLELIRQMQLSKIKKEGFENVCRLEFEFVKPMCEMELNGITIDREQWNIILNSIDIERDQASKIVSDMLNATIPQTTLFGVPLVNIDSNVQLKKIFNKIGLQLENTSIAALSKYEGVPVVDALLDYRKAQKFVSTYGDSLLAKIHEKTGRLHTSFKQMVSTGRMSSSDPNLQNIPKKQKYRSCFVAKPGYKLITSDMSGAELRILGNLSEDPVFVDCFNNGIDLHSKSASEIYNVAINAVDKSMRNACKALSFGLCYGLSKYGLAKRLGITEKAAEELINKYFSVFKGIKRFLDAAEEEAVMNRCTKTISGRKRFYRIPEWDDPDKNKIIRAIGRQGKNAGIQGANADTIKESMILCVDRLEKGNYDARLLLTVHDEIIVEVRDDQVEEVSKVVEGSLIEGFGKYFKKIPMETEALVGPCWLKGGCEKCKSSEMKFIKDGNKNKLVCSKCGTLQE